MQSDIVASHESRDMNAAATTAAVSNLRMCRPSLTRVHPASYQMSALPLREAALGTDRGHARRSRDLHRRGPVALASASQRTPSRCRSASSAIVTGGVHDRRPRRTRLLDRLEGPPLQPLHVLCPDPRSHTRGPLRLQRNQVGDAELGGFLDQPGETVAIAGRDGKPARSRRREPNRQRKSVRGLRKDSRPAWLHLPRPARPAAGASRLPARAAP